MSSTLLVKATDKGYRLPLMMISVKKSLGTMKGSATFVVSPKAKENSTQVSD